MRIRLIGLMLLFAVLSYGQRINISRQGEISVVALADLPADPGTRRRIYAVTDSLDCETDGAAPANPILCVWNGVDGWQLLGDGGGSGGAVDSVNGQTGVVVLDAGDVGVTPAGGIAATLVQAALEELDTEKEPVITANSLGPGDIDETANYVFSGTLFPTGTAPTTSAVGQLALDTNAWGASRGALQFFDGTSTVWLCGVLSSDTPVNGQVIKFNTGGTCTWESDLLGGDFFGNFATPTELTLSAGSVTTTGSAAYLLDTEADAGTDDWTGVTCAAGTSFSVRAANDARTVVIKNSSIPTPFAADVSLDQDGDIALVFCQAANQPEVILFKDEAGSLGGDGPTELILTDKSAADEPSTAGDTAVIIDSDTGLLASRQNGQAQKDYMVIDAAQVPTNKTIDGNSNELQMRRASDCTALTDGVIGEVCADTDDGALFVCVPSAGACDTAGEWKAQGGGGCVIDLFNPLFSENGGGTFTQASGIDRGANISIGSGTFQMDDNESFEWLTMLPRCWTSAETVNVLVIVSWSGLTTTGSSNFEIDTACTGDGDASASYSASTSITGMSCSTCSTDEHYSAVLSAISGCSGGDYLKVRFTFDLNGRTTDTTENLKGIALYN